MRGEKKKKLDLKFSSKPRHWKGKCECEWNVKQSYMYPADIVLVTAAAAATDFSLNEKNESGSYYPNRN